MCGIAGFLSFANSLSPLAHGAFLESMTESLRQRGPDDSGLWFEPQGRLALGFRRLSVLDLTPAGHQPMFSSSGRSVIVLNGEIYNHQALRGQLESLGHSFISRSDTEVLLIALEVWGLAKTLASLNGMFAFAWYDLSNRVLTLARDHAGIKPLWYALTPRGFTFASQFDTLLKGPWGIPGELDSESLWLYLKLHHLPPPRGFYKNTFQLQPGRYLQIDASGQLHESQWWGLPRLVEENFLSPPEALPMLADTLRESVRGQRLADVPVGVFLSGGVDSPLVSAIARQQVGSSLQAFTISIPGWGQDESEDATNYARHLGLDHHLITLSSQDALNALDQVIQALHEPFGDYSIIPTFLVSKFARPLITVALSGDGGDELFFGYERPLSLLRDGSLFRFPWLIRAGLYGLGKYGLIPKKSGAILSRDPGDYYFGVNSRMPDALLAKLAPSLGDLKPDLGFYAFKRYRGQRDLANFSRYVEYYGQLQRGLKKVDLASSQVSLEVRVPFLDKQLIELSLRVDPFEMLKNQQRKWFLRQMLGRYVPPGMIPTSKRGFAVPLGDWLRGPLKSRVEGALFDQPLFPLGFFDRGRLAEYWQQHLSGGSDHKWGLWSILALQWWAREHLP